ncbi:MAG: acetyl-CoA synthase subunit gamma [Firmicutes bacterium]|nr:acetyl-CoA synthase subunit gamma [Bacillota bacterium]
MSRQPSCQDRRENPGKRDPEWITGWVESGAGLVPRVSTRLSLEDTLGMVGVRLGIGRFTYRVPPGLYAVGSPGRSSPVVITANYKMTFDLLRRQIDGRDTWVVVLDTYGINVWCAAGKGTFGTAEVVRRLAAVRLPEVVDHRTIILPQLGAPGVAAHEVRRRSGFEVVYGPVRAADLGRFLERDMKADPGMRRVRFGFLDRLVLVPVELLGSWTVLAAGVLLAFIMRRFGGGHVPAGAFRPGIRDLMLAAASAVVAGSVAVPIALPWIPGRAFSLKGWIAGLLVSAGLCATWVTRHGATGAGTVAATLLIWPAASAYIALNFTGATPVTSFSGVKREMRIALPTLACSVVAGLAFWFLL